MGFRISEIPRLKVGLDYVPVDDYPAILHEGEAVLTKEENAEYRRNIKGTQKDNDKNKNKKEKYTGTNVTLKIQNFYNNRKEDIKQLAEELAFYANKKKLSKGEN